VLTFRKNRSLIFLELLLPPLLGFHSVTSLTFSLTILAHISIPNPHFSISGPVPVSSVRASVLNTLCSLFQLRNLLLGLWCSVVRCRGLKTSSFGKLGIFVQVCFLHVLPLFYALYGYGAFAKY